MNDYLKDAWKYYEYGRRYNNNLIPNQYTMVNTNQEFFIGNQWIHMPDNPAMRRLAKPTFNIIKRVTSLFVASLTSSNTTISFEPLSYQTDGEAAAFATAEVRNLLEKFKMDYRIRDALLTEQSPEIMQRTFSGILRQGRMAELSESTRVKSRWNCWMASM